VPITEFFNTFKKAQLLHIRGFFFVPNGRGLIPPHEKKKKKSYKKGQQGWMTGGWENDYEEVWKICC
jgi:hypothetical protein